MADLNLKLLSILSSERSIYGLRNNDNERYRRHCSNKLHRLRQVTHTTHGKGKVYKKPPPLVPTTVQHLQLLLFSSERALAHAHSTPKSERKAQLSWLRRAVSFSNELYSVSTNARTHAEITIYHLSLRAELAFTKSQWAEALTDLAIRRNLLSALASSAVDSYESALAHEFIDPFDPWIRFCAYKLGRPESHDISGVVADIDLEMMTEAMPDYSPTLASISQSSTTTPPKITFAGTTIHLRSAEIVSAITKAQNAMAKLDNGRMKSWDRVLSVLGDAETIAKRLLDEHQASTTELRSPATNQALSLTHQYTVHLVLTHRIRRDLLLIDSLPIPEPTTRSKREEAVKNLGAVIKLHDAVLQSLAQIRSLPVVEEKDDLREETLNTELYFHSAKCYYLARLHTIHPDPSYASAVQLLARCETPHGPTLVPAKAIPYAELELEAKRLLFAERVPKPVFFDTAFNYIDLPMDDLYVLAGKKVKEADIVPKQEAVMAVDGMESGDVDEPTPEAEKPKGWLGWFKK